MRFNYDLPVSESVSPQRARQSVSLSVTDLKPTMTGGEWKSNFPRNEPLESDKCENLNG